MLHAAISVMLGVSCSTSSIGTVISDSISLGDAHDRLLDLRQQLRGDAEYREYAEQDNDRRDDYHGGRIGKTYSSQPHWIPPLPFILSLGHKLPMVFDHGHKPLLHKKMPVILRFFESRFGLTAKLSRCHAWGDTSRPARYLSEVPLYSK
jgi:hypothetical protein